MILVLVILMINDLIDSSVVLLCVLLPRIYLY